MFVCGLIYSRRLWIVLAVRSSYYEPLRKRVQPEAENGKAWHVVHSKSIVAWISFHDFILQIIPQLRYSNERHTYSPEHFMLGVYEWHFVWPSEIVLLTAMVNWRGKAISHVFENWKFVRAAENERRGGGGGGGRGKRRRRERIFIINYSHDVVCLPPSVVHSVSALCLNNI